MVDDAVSDEDLQDIFNKLDENGDGVLNIEGKTDLQKKLNWNDFQQCTSRIALIVKMAAKLCKYSLSK
jgi:hypothetical protein